MNSAEARRIFASAPFIADLGMQLESLSPGECATSLWIKPRHLQQDGFVHAGILATMGDHTAGGAGATLLPAGHQVLSLEFKINLLRPAKGDSLRCRAKVLKSGRRFIIVESEVFSVAVEGERLAAKATVTLAVVPSGPEPKP
jgi:uncharacterized protein (TIGR00369 family)